MVYQNPNGGSRDMAMFIAYALNKDFRRTQEEIRNNFIGKDGKPVSQSTVHNWIKDVQHRVETKDLQRELDAAREYIRDLESGKGQISSADEPLLLPKP